MTAAKSQENRFQEPNHFLCGLVLGQNSTEINVLFYFLTSLPDSLGASLSQAYAALPGMEACFVYWYLHFWMEMLYFQKLSICNFPNIFIL